jgi:hypothetical protein
MEQLLKKQESYLKLIVDNTGDSVKVQKEDSSVSLASIDKNIADLHMTIYEQLDAVINGLKEVNDSIIQTFVTLDDAQISLNKGINRLIEINDDKSSSSVIPSTSRENEVEGVRREESSLKEQAKQTDVLEDIRDNTDPKKKKDKKEEGFKFPDIPKMGLFVSGLAVSLGAIAGLVKGYVKILGSIGKAFLDAGKFLIGKVQNFGIRVLKFIDSFLDAFPNLKAAITKFGARIISVIDDVKDLFTKFVKNIPKLIDAADQIISSQWSKFKTFLSNAPLRIMSFIDDLILKLPPKIAGPIIQFLDEIPKAFDSAVKYVKDIPRKIIDVFKSIGSVFTDLAKVDEAGNLIAGGSERIKKVVDFFKAIGPAIDEFLKPIKAFFSAVKGYADDFAKIFKGVMPIFEKLALPLTVIMAVWDTAKGAIEGFEKEGIVGAIKGAITGLINSLIGGVLDLIKGAISWVAGALGFKNVEKALDSFSFQDLFKKAVDAVFGFMTSIGDWISNKIEAVKNFFGFGTKEKKDAAQTKLNDAKKQLEMAKEARVWGSIATDDKGGITAKSTNINGSYDIQGPKDENAAAGLRELSDVEKDAYLAEKMKAVAEAESALGAVDKIPTLANIWKDFNFGDAVSTAIATMFGTIPDLLKGTASWVAGLFGFDKVKEKLDAISITDMYKEAIDSVINLVSAIGDWISEKISSVKNFLGFGKSEEQAQKELDRAKRRRENFSGAARVGAVGYDVNGNIMTSTMMSNGVFNREAARNNILSQGGREMTEEEAAKYEANLEEEVKRREDEFKKISEAPTLGKLFKEMVLEPLTRLFDKLNNIFNEFVVQPIQAMVSDIEGIAQEYIIDPVKSLFDKITSLIDEYIAQPLNKFFSPLVDFFRQIPEQLKGIFEYVGIPEFKYTIPLVGKEISIGPFYPFRPGKDETKISANNSVSSSTSYEPEGRTSSRTVSRSASTVTDERSAVIQRERTSLSITDAAGKVVGSEASSKRISAAYDTKTGSSSVYVDKDTAEQLRAAGLQVDERGSAQVSNRAFRLLKNASDEKKGISSSVEILKEDADYQKLTWLDKRKVDVGYAKASELLKDPKYQDLSKPAVSPLPGLSQNVYDKSVRNDQMKMDANAQQAPVVVNAATTNVANNRQNIVAPVPLRNQDSSLNRYVDRRAVF